jgi:hypothetical protein
VTTNIHPVPRDLPVVDDHVLNIFVRRYGSDDQRAEALAALASYDGIPAAVLGFSKIPKTHGVSLTFVQIGHGLAVFDVNNRVVFRRVSGELASLDDLKRDPSIVRRAAGNLTVDGVPYDEHLRRLSDAHPTFVRMEDQRPWSRLRNEVARFVAHQ